MKIYGSASHASAEMAGPPSPSILIDVIIIIPAPGFCLVHMPRQRQSLRPKHSLFFGPKTLVRSWTGLLSRLANVLSWL